MDLVYFPPLSWLFIFPHSLDFYFPPLSGLFIFPHSLDCLFSPTLLIGGLWSIPTSPATSSCGWNSPSNILSGPLWPVFLLKCANQNFVSSQWNFTRNENQMRISNYIIMFKQNFHSHTHSHPHTHMCYSVSIDSYYFPPIFIMWKENDPLKMLKSDVFFWPLLTLVSRLWPWKFFNHQIIANLPKSATGIVRFKTFKIWVLKK